VRSIPRDANTPLRIGQLLRDLKAPETCYLISESEKIDGRVADLNVALDEVIGGGVACVVYCRANLALYEGEGPSDRLLLYRATAPHRR
jgi:hypothetical protein